MAIASESGKEIPELDEMPGSLRMPDKRVYRIVKRVLDVLIALTAMLVLLAPMLVIALLILIVDGRPVIYRQTRLGQGGSKITILKFRSMCPDADKQLDKLKKEQLEQYRREFKIDYDPRVTRLGAFLRRTSLDELPQLWNILRGNLSVVGPRPILPDEIGFYSPKEREQFLSVPPGLTGYWQACAGSEDTYTSGRRQKMELHYTMHFSFSFDAKIVLKTFAALVRKAGKEQIQR